jgi:magnesium transporter
VHSNNIIISSNLHADWIAHGLMDSIVDAFFPLLKDIQKEVLLVEDFVSGLDHTDRDDDESNPFDRTGSGVEIVVANGRHQHTAKLEMREKNEKSEHDTASMDTKKERRLPLGTKLIEWWKIIWSRRRQNSTLIRDVNRLRRMAITRRLVTTLGRLLSAKLEVIAQIRKRLDGQGEVAIYLGDVQDHIISLNQSLIHYERMLSHSHPTYVTHLRLSLSEAKGGLDRGLLLLTLVSLLVLCNQVISSLCSLNVNLPRSDDFQVFGWVVAVALIVSILLLGVVRYWYVKARGKLWIKMPWRN